MSLTYNKELLISDSEHATKCIARDLLRLCSKKSIIISKACAEYLVSLMAMHPELGCGKDNIIRRKNYKKLEELCFEKCKQITSLETLQMQVYFTTEVSSIAELVNENREQIKKQVDPIKKDLFRKNPQSGEEIENAYYVLVTLMILGSGIGSITNSTALKETSVALQSVFQIHEFCGLLVKPLQEKEKEIDELIAIVAGIRLFNHSCNRGGSYIENLPENLSREIESMYENIHMLLEKLTFKINMLTSAVENYFCKSKSQDSLSSVLSHKNSARVSLASDLSYKIVNEGLIKEDEAEAVKDALITARQFEIFLMSLKKDVGSVEINKENLERKLETCLSKLHNTVQQRTAIPTNEIYPQFIDLFSIWTEFQDEIHVIKYLNDVMWNLNSHAQVLDNLDDSVLKQMIGDCSKEILRNDATEISSIPQDQVACRVINDENTTNVQNLPLELNGFCIWCLVHGKGALIPGNPHLGLCEYNGVYYSFSNVNAGIEFGRDPYSYIIEAISTIRRKAELINMLKIQDLDNLPKEGLQRAPTTADVDVQTELHPIQSYIDPSYSWNEWDYRKRVLQMAYLTHCKTKSVQTGKSHWRQDAWTYVSMPFREKSSQTKRDASTNVPQPRRYSYGLRGRAQSQNFHMINLTRPVDE